MDVDISEALSGRTVLNVLAHTLRLSRSSIRSLKFSGEILLNGERAHTDRRVAAGDRITLRFADRHAPAPALSEQPLRVAYEDAHLLVVDKPAPMPSVSSAHRAGETLENLVFTHLSAPEGFVYRPVNRLDKGTSGLMLIAKSAHAQHLMQQRLHGNSFIREYQAVVSGVPQPDSGLIDRAISRDGAVKRRVDPCGRPAKTLYQVEQTGSGHALIRLRLLTGRTHQIRVHMQFLGCPVAGDFLYGQESPLLPGRFALHSCLLRFLHPFDEKWVECLSPPPPVFNELLARDMQENAADARYISETH